MCGLIRVGNIDDMFLTITQFSDRQRESVLYRRRVSSIENEGLRPIGERGNCYRGRRLTIVVVMDDAKEQLFLLW